MILVGGRSLSLKGFGGSAPRFNNDFLLLTLCVACGLFIWTSFTSNVAQETLAREPSALPLDGPTTASLADSGLSVGDGSTLAAADSDSTIAVETAVSEPDPIPVPVPPPVEQPLAIIVETKPVPNLVPLMLHFSNLLGHNWTVVLYTLEANWDEPTSHAFAHAISDHRINIRFLPPSTSLTNSRSVSEFLTQPWLWTQLSSASRILLFQSDSVICSKSPFAIDDFLEYDYIGAPIDPKFGQGYNGGLSLRNPKLFLQIAQDSNFTESGAAFEDQWFYAEAKARNASLPTPEVAKTFSVETIYYEEPLGFHQPKRWLKDHMAQVEEYCPEVKMLIGRRAT